MSKDYIRRAVERTGLRRERFTESQVPDSLAHLVIVPFFGDLRSEFVFSTLLLNDFKRQNPQSYLVVCSWPQHFGLYPYVDEYWSLPDESSLINLAKYARGFNNEKAIACERTLLNYFDQVKSQNAFCKYYDRGLTSTYLQERKEVLYTLPSIPSVDMKYARQLIGKTKTVFIYPAKYINDWQRQTYDLLPVPKNFWLGLCQSLLKNGIHPVVYQNYATHDISDEFNDGVYVDQLDILSVLGVMRACNCVLDVFSGISRYAYIARCPTLICDERRKYVEFKEYELDDLCAKNIPKKYVFSYVNVAENNQFLIDTIVNKLLTFLPTIKNDALPSTTTSERLLSYDGVRQRSLKRLGTRFIVPPNRDEDF